MEKHFLADMMAAYGEPGFKAEPFYFPCGDYIDYTMVSEAPVAHYVDEWLTIYDSAVDGRPIGFQIKHVRTIIEKFGLAGQGIALKANGQSVKDISISALLLAAYEQGPLTSDRRNAYAIAMGFPVEKQLMPASELQPA